MPTTDFKPNASPIPMPDEAVKAVLLARHGAFVPQWEGRIASTRRELEAAYPSIRCQVLESVVEDVAARMERVAGAVGPRDLFREHTREALGVPSEGEGS